MSYYWAKFEEIQNDTFRFDTRVYLNLIGNPSDNDLCIGAVVGKNPGSAKPLSYKGNVLQKIDLDGDQLLPNVRSIFLKAYKQSEREIPQNSYIQVLNLMYVCDKNLSEAIKKIACHSNPIMCDTEKKQFPFLWYLWGADNKKLNIYKQRFCNLNADIHFYVDTKTTKVISNIPTIKDSVRHTQGLKHGLVVPYISNII